MPVPKTIPKPTDGELSILRVLWERGPSTVRQVFEVLSAERDLGYTTVLKMLQIMAEKGLVARDESERTHVYRASEAAALTRATLVEDLMERAFGGSAMQLVMHALASRKATPAELAEIRKLLEVKHGRA
jgi:predicted transcriptional regulator